MRLDRSETYFLYCYCLNIIDAQPDDEDCNDHRAGDDNVAWKGIDVTGIGSLACGRNGFFIPTATVDLQKSEQWVVLMIQTTKALTICTDRRTWTMQSVKD